jgi:hypothetical protein
MKNLDALVSRFLAWPLPADVCADGCATVPNYPHRSGTSLLTAAQARQMLEHVLAGVPTSEDAAAWVDARRDAFAAEHGSIDPDTGTLEFGRGAHAEGKAEYVAELDEIADALRVLGTTTSKQRLSVRLPPGFEASRNENGSITVTNDLHSIIVEADAASARQAPEEMLHALLVALGA